MSEGGDGDRRTDEDKYGGYWAVLRPDTYLGTYWADDHNKIVTICVIKC